MRKSLERPMGPHDDLEALEDREMEKGVWVLGCAWKTLAEDKGDDKLLVCHNLLFSVEGAFPYLSLLLQ